MRGTHALVNCRFEILNDFIVMPSQVIKIVSGWSNPGGSTIHHIALTNMLNEAGYQCTFYGPHDWHLDKCKADKAINVRIAPTDILISHFIKPATINCKRHILSCHETNLFPLRQMNLKGYSLIHYVSHRQQQWHDVEFPFVVIPPSVERIPWQPPGTNTAGIIGSIDPHKQTHLSIQRAIADNFQKVLLFGKVSDKTYFNDSIKPLLANDNVFLMDHCDDKVKMYSAVDAVYHNSKRETFGLVEAECIKAGIPFIGSSNHPEILDRKEILTRWIEILH